MKPSIIFVDKQARQAILYHRHCHPWGCTSKRLLAPKQRLEVLQFNDDDDDDDDDNNNNNNNNNYNYNNDNNNDNVLCHWCQWYLMIIN